MYQLYNLVLSLVLCLQGGHKRMASKALPLALPYPPTPADGEERAREATQKFSF